MVGRADASSSGSMSSIPPVAESVRAQAVVVEQRSSKAPWFIAAAAGLVLVLGAAGVVASGKVRVPGLATAGPGTVVITASGPGGKAVDGLRVLANGDLKCEASPCRIDGLKAGTHFISAEAKGYETTAARAVSVAAGDESALHIDLSPTAQPQEPKADSKAAAAPAPKAEADKAEKPATAAAPAPAAAGKKAPISAAKKTAVAAKAAGGKAGKADKAPAAQPAAMGTLNINSIPRANAVLDGRPIGMTPRMGMSVPAGSHTVVFVHPEKGRKVGSATVQAGKSATIAVRF